MTFVKTQSVIYNKDNLPISAAGNGSSKFCNGCKIEKKLSEFYIVNSKSRGRFYQSKCKTCETNRANNFNKNNPDKHRASSLRYIRKHPIKVSDRKRKDKYGVTGEEYTSMLALQNNLCAICNKIMKNPHVDHDHRSNRVRGLLCSKCNCGLGLFKENIGYINSAIEYINNDGII